MDADHLKQTMSALILLRFQLLVSIINLTDSDTNALKVQSFLVLIFFQKRVQIEMSDELAHVTAEK